MRRVLLEIASALEDQTGIPAIAHQAVLLEEIQTDQWWEGVTVPLLEHRLTSHNGMCDYPTGKSARRSCI
jgi:hypothetical protein